MYEYVLNKLLSALLVFCCICELYLSDTNKFLKTVNGVLYLLLPLHAQMVAICSSAMKLVANCDMLTYRINYCYICIF